MAKSPEEMRKEMIEKLSEKTGKTLSQWQALIRAAGLTRHGEVMKLLSDDQKTMLRNILTKEVPDKKKDDDKKKDEDKKKE